MTPPKIERASPEPFRLDLDMIDRLAQLAKATRRSGNGLLASANYYGQGTVAVPSAWLAEILARIDRSGLPTGGDEK